MTKEQQEKQNLIAFLSLIGFSEGANYDTLFGGAKFSDFTKHPNKVVTACGYKSTAAGKYQFLFSTWKATAAKLGLKDFTPASQDKAAEYLIKQQGALQNVKDGKLKEALNQTCDVWASFPVTFPSNGKTVGKSYYGQPVRSYSLLEQKFKAFGGALEGSYNRTPGDKKKPDESQAKKISAGLLALVALLFVGIFFSK